MSNAERLYNPNLADQGILFYPEHINNTSKTPLSIEEVSGVVNGLVGNPSAEIDPQDWDIIRTSLHTVPIEELNEQIDLLVEETGKHHLSSGSSSATLEERHKALMYIINQPEEVTPALQKVIGGVDPKEFVPYLQKIAEGIIATKNGQLPSIIDSTSVIELQAITKDLKPKEDVTIYNTLDKVTQILEEDDALLQLPPTVKPLARLLLFNALKHTSEVKSEQIQGVIERIKQFSIIEQQFSNPQIPLPTIGTEGESHMRYDESLNWIRAMGIPLYKEVSGDLWEVPLPYSYSAEVQQATFLELMKSGFIPLEQSNRVLNAHRQYPISFHINLGSNGLLPKGALSKNMGEIYKLSDALSIAHVSPERIEQRKTRIAVTVDDAKKSGKSHATENSVLRLELRVPDYRGTKSAPLLQQSQYLGGMLFA
ncbi:MAG TPA: hypothetical protein PLS49_05450, partial [Candidatus Woesebacteria bacterium]|nr:hypothetical protein [Candidatus Woesebacteria bacterium]